MFKCWCHLDNIHGYVICAPFQLCRSVACCRLKFINIYLQNKWNNDLIFDKTAFLIQNRDVRNTHAHKYYLGDVKMSTGHSMTVYMCHRYIIFYHKSLNSSWFGGRTCKKVRVKCMSLYPSLICWSCIQGCYFRSQYLVSLFYYDNDILLHSELEKKTWKTWM